MITLCRLRATSVCPAAGSSYLLRAALSRRALGPASGRAACMALAMLWATALKAQTTPSPTPVIIPSTITTVVGSSPVATTSGSACPTNARYTATDTVGDGCPAVNATLASPNNIAVDPAGNLYISSSASTNAVRRVDARTGIITSYAGITANQCASSGGVKIYGTTATQIDKTGEGCPVSATGAMNTVQSLGRDPYGNVLIGSKDDIVSMACNAVSPLCSAANVGENILVGLAGCTAGATTAYATAVAGTTPGTAGDGTLALQTTSGCTVGVSAYVYGLTADKWDNVYFMDGSNQRIRVIAGAPTVTINGTSYTNPLYATLATSTTSPINYGGGGTNPLGVHQGYIYPIAGGGTVCSGKTDAYGDGCPFYQTIVYTSSNGGYIQGLTTDLEGDLIFADGEGDLRVIYMGGQLIKGALSANGITSPVVGYSYLLLGGGTAYNYNSGNPGVKLGTQAALQSHAIQTLTTDPGGNILIGDQEQILFYDIATGYYRRLGTSNNTATCNSSSVGDGCNLNPAGSTGSTGAVFGAGSAVLSVAEDAQGNLYVLDISHLSVRRVAAAALPTSAVNGSLTTTLDVHAPTGGSSISLTPAASNDISVGTPACATNSDSSVDCTATVTYNPKALAQRSDPLTIATTVSGNTTNQTVPLNGLSTGSALVFDTAGTPLVNTLGTALTNNSKLALDGAGNVYVYGNQGIDKISGSVVTNVTGGGGLFNYIAVDPAGNVYAGAIGSSSLTEFVYTAGSYSSGTTINLPTLSFCTGTSSPAAYSCGAATQTYTGPFVVDGEGVIYIADPTNKQLFKFDPATGLAQQLTQTALNSPTQMAQDSYGNLLIIDGTSVLKVPPSGFTVNVNSPYANPTVTFSPALTSPTSVAADQGGNVYVADSGLIKVSAYTSSTYASPVSYTVPDGVTLTPSTPTTAGNGSASTFTITAAYSTDTLSGTLSIAVGSGSATTLTVANGTTLTSLATQINGNTTLSGESVSASVSGNVLTVSGPPAVGNTLSTTGTALADAAFAKAIAVDGFGNLYVVQSSAPGVTQITRNAESFAFGTNQTESFVGVLSNAGATVPTGFTQTDSAGDFTVTAPSSPLATSASTCNLTSTILAPGVVCNAAFSFTPTANGSGTVTDAVSLTMAGVTNTVGAVTVTGSKTGTSATTTTSIAGNTAGLVYSTGTETTFTVTVSESPAAVPAGTVAVTIDNGTPVNYNLTIASSSTSTATITISGLTATAHTIFASYAGSTGITSSTSTTINFTIAQATPTIAWTPSAMTQLYSAPLSPVATPVLNAGATSSGSGVAGVFVYTANGAEVNAASYLPIGAYTLAATFYPTDSTDYTSQTFSLATNGYTVTKATTTAPIGATQTLVASDGSGNYTSIQAAINAVGIGGGSVYIKPGTYTGFLTVTQPNVALRGLGGDPTQVILTNSSGAFNNGQAQNAGVGAFANVQLNGSQLPAGSGNSSGVLFSGDEGSATIVIGRGINTALSTSATTPNNFYAEDLTFQNTYNTDSTPTTTYLVSNACTANAGTSQTYAYLYNNGLQCASQALAIWITSDTAVLNNVYTTSAQDTIYAGSISSGSYPARQFWFRGKVTGNVDYIFGDAAAVFDHTSIYTTVHYSGTNDGTETIEAQNSSSPTFLSGYVMNSDVFTSQTPGMNTGTSNANLYFGRPYGAYSTYIMLNSLIDQVSSAGYIPFSGSYALTDATYGEYNDSVYTDPGNGQPDANGVIYSGAGGNSGSGVLPLSARESASTDPAVATPFSASTSNSVAMTPAQAQQFYPLAFLGKTISTNSYNTVATWSPTAAIASEVNAFVPSTSPSSIIYGQSITLLMRPQTPGLGAVTNGVYTIPTGTWSLSDSVNGATATVIASGTLDASGEAYFTTSGLANGTHSFSWTYGGDTNFATSTTTSAYALTVSPLPSTTTTSLSSSGNPSLYGTSPTITATITSAGETPAGTVTFTIDGVVQPPVVLNGSGQATYTFNTPSATGHSVQASYSGQAGSSSAFAASSASLTQNITQRPLSLSPLCSNRAFDTANNCSVAINGTYALGDSAATVFASGPTATTTATLNSPAGSYPTSATYTLTSKGTADYAITVVASNFTIVGSGNAAQTVIFPPLPALPSGTYQLTARTTSGLPVTYTVTGAGASITGSTLTLSGATGNIIQVTATATDPKGDYATATATRSFTAQ